MRDAQDDWRAAFADWMAEFPPETGVPAVPEDTLWEDVAFAALKVAQQQGQFLYNPQSVEAVAGLLESYGASPADMEPSPDTTNFVHIQPGEHSAPAQAAPAFHALLQALGLVADSAWTPETLPALWRGWANMTATPPEQTDLFADYVDQAARMAPADVVQQIERLAHFSPETLSKAETALMQKGSATDAASQRDKAAQTNAMHLEMLITERWRAERCWLNDAARCRTFCPWFDGLADRLAEALLLRLFPQSDLSERRAPCNARPALN